MSELEFYVSEIGWKEKWLKVNSCRGFISQEAYCYKFARGPQRWSCKGQGHIIVCPQRNHQSFVSKFVVLFLMSSFVVLDICHMFSSFSLKPLLVVES